MKHAPEYYLIVAVAASSVGMRQLVHRLVLRPALCLALGASLGFSLLGQQRTLAEENAGRIERMEGNIQELEERIIDFSSPIMVALISGMLGTMTVAGIALIRLGSCVNGHTLQICTLLKDSENNTESLHEIDLQLTKVAAVMGTVEERLGRLSARIKGP